MLEFKYKNKNKPDKAYKLRLPECKSKVKEIDTVLLLYNELLNPEFAKYFLKKIGINNVGAVIKYMEISVNDNDPEPEYGLKSSENDLVVEYVYVNKPQEVHGILVEAKADAKAQPGQPERYQKRCKKYTEYSTDKIGNVYATCIDVLFAPKEYFILHEESAGKYSKYVYFDELIAEYYECQKCRDSLVTKKIMLLELATEKVGVTRKNYRTYLGMKAFVEYLQIKHQDIYRHVSCDNGKTVMQSLCIRNENSCNFVLYTEFGREAWVADAHFNSNKYFIRFANPGPEKRNPNNIGYVNLLDYIKEVAGDEYLLAFGKPGKSWVDVFLKGTTVPKFRYKDIFEISNGMDVNTGTNITPSEIKKITVAIKPSKIDMVEKSVEEIRKLLEFGNCLKREKLCAIYSENKLDKISS